MGGERETTLKQRQSGAQAELTGRHAQKLRVHESGGQAHFHDDALGIKCAVPVAVWHNLMGRLRLGKRVKYFDPANQTLLDMQAGSSDGTFDVRYRLQKQAVGPTLAALVKFTDG